MSWRPNHWMLRWVFLAIWLVRRATTRDVKNAGSGERTILAREPAGERGDLLHLDEAPHRNLGKHELGELRRDLLEDRGLRRGGGHAIHEHAALGELLAERFGECDEAAFGRAEGGGVGVAFLAGDRSDVDDAPVARFHHVRHHGTAAEERPRQ